MDTCLPRSSVGDLDNLNTVDHIDYLYDMNNLYVARPSVCRELIVPPQICQISYPILYQVLKCGHTISPPGAHRCAGHIDPERP